MPLALLTDMQNAELRQVVETVCERLLAESTDDEQAELLLTASYLLGGLRFPDTIITSLFEGMLNMLEESSTYQALIQRGLARGVAMGIEQGREQGHEEGLVDGARRSLQRLGEKRLGVPTAATQERIDSIGSLEQAEYFMDRLFSVETWDDLLAS